MLISPCENCIIDSICTIGCEKLNIENIKEDWVECNTIIKRIISNKFNQSTNRTFNSFKIYIGENYIRFYNLNKKLHRDGDEPTVIYLHGTVEYWKNGKIHRDGDEPAVIRSDGTIKYYKNGERHRDGDKPAVIHLNGIEEYWKYGKSHRDGDKPAIIYSDGTLYYYKNGNLHRDGNKPAVIRPNGNIEYWKEGILNDYKSL